MKNVNGLEFFGGAPDTDAQRINIAWKAVNYAGFVLRAGKRLADQLPSSIKSLHVPVLNAGNEEVEEALKRAIEFVKAGNIPRTTGLDDYRLSYAEYCVAWVAEFSAPTAETAVNLTQHPTTAEQVAAGVIEPENKAAVQAALTFDAIPSGEEMAQRANFLAAIAKESGCTKAMIGGAPFFMSALELALKAAGITPVYAFSVRDSKEESDGNGGVRKVAVFKHVGFVEV